MMIRKISGRSEPAGDDSYRTWWLRHNQCGNCCWCQAKLELRAPCRMLIGDSRAVDRADLHGSWKSIP